MTLRLLKAHLILLDFLQDHLEIADVSLVGLALDGQESLDVIHGLHHFLSCPDVGLVIEVRLLLFDHALLQDCKVLDIATDFPVDALLDLVIAIVTTDNLLQFSLY